jgi:hypothetical protein
MKIKSGRAEAMGFSSGFVGKITEQQTALHATAARRYECKD